SEKDFAARIVRGRKSGLFEDIESYRRKLGRIDFVFFRSSERRSQDNFSGSHALSRRDGREVAGQHLRGWNETKALTWSGSLDRRLLADKKEQLVLDERSSDRAAELVPLQVVPSGRKGVSCVEDAVPQ